MRTKTVKKASRVIIEKYYGRLTQDFHTNKRVCAEVAVIQTKRLRNKIAGFTTVRGRGMATAQARGKAELPCTCMADACTAHSQITACLACMMDRIAKLVLARPASPCARSI